MALLLAGMVFVTGYAQAGVTASGVHTHAGTAACPPDVAFGTRLAIEGIGQVVCEDAYAPWLSPRVDVYFPTVAECYAITGPHAVRVLSMPAQ